MFVVILLTSEVEIGKEAPCYFQALFTTEETSSLADVSHIIPHLVTSQDNDMLGDIPSYGEVHCVVFDMNGDSIVGFVASRGNFHICMEYYWARYLPKSCQFLLWG